MEREGSKAGPGNVPVLELHFEEATRRRPDGLPKRQLERPSTTTIPDADQEELQADGARQHELGQPRANTQNDIPFSVRASSKGSPTKAQNGQAIGNQGAKSPTKVNAPSTYSRISGKR